jgi:hypothetical protein
MVRGYERICDWEMILLEFRSSKGRAGWLEEELEDLVCDVTCDIFTAIFRV